MTQVYTPSEVAQILKITEDEVVQLVQQGELAGFRVINDARIKEEALVEFMNKPYAGSPDAPTRSRSRGPGGPAKQKPNRDPEAEAAGRQWAWEQIRQIAPGLSVHSKTRFTANGKQGVLPVSTTTSGPRGDYWFGFDESLLESESPLFIVPLLADRRIAFVVPYARHKAAFDGLSLSKQGRKEFHVTERLGMYYLTGKGIGQPIPLDSYVNAFDLLR